MIHILKLHFMYRNGNWLRIGDAPMRGNARLSNTCVREVADI